MKGPLKKNTKNKTFKTFKEKKLRVADKKHSLDVLLHPERKLEQVGKQLEDKIDEMVESANKGGL